MTQVTLGQRVRVTATFRDSTGALADPTTVVAYTRTPQTSVRTALSVTRSSTGVYYVEQDMSVSGGWPFRFEGAGAVVSAYERQIDVLPSLFA